MPGPLTKSFDLRLHQFAPMAVAVAVPISLIAAIALWVARGVVATTMLEGTAFAIVAAYPVWRAYRKRVQAEQESQPTPAGDFDADSAFR